MHVTVMLVSGSEMMDENEPYIMMIALQVGIVEFFWLASVIIVYSYQLLCYFMFLHEY